MRSAAYLTREQEASLITRWKDGDQRALDTLILAHLRMCRAMARRFSRYGVDPSDLVSEGTIGLMTAANKFDPDHGVRFNTYALLWIKATMQDYIVRNWSIVRGGTSSAHKNLFFNVRRLRAKLEQQQITGDEVDRAVGDLVGVSARDVSEISNRLSHGDVALDKPVSHDDGEGSRLIDFFVSPEPLPDQVVEEQIDGERISGRISRALARLPDRERNIIKRRFLDDAGDTLETIGDAYGISKERVRQLESRALARLRHSMRAA